jgi:hypothetical protein
VAHERVQAVLNEEPAPAVSGKVLEELNRVMAEAAKAMKDMQLPK